MTAIRIGGMTRALVVTALACAPLIAARAQSGWIADRGVLPRGTTYEMRRPDNWNGTLISNLDFASSADTPTNAWLLRHGYALSGTARRADRATNYDPAHEIIDLINVMDLFAAKFGRPQRTIQFGESGGGFVTLAMAELHPDRIDGAVAACAVVPAWAQNSEFDAFFVLQALIAPDLPATNRPSDAPARWAAALKAAQETPVGRARIALALTIGQRPAWSSTSTPEPKPDDIVALQQSMFETLLALASLRGPATAGGSLSSNDGVDYTMSFRNGEVANQKATRALYAQASASLDADLRTLSNAPRTRADALAINWWSSPGRTVLGEPKVPLLRIHTSGDGTVIPAMVQGYDAAVGARGYGDLYHTAFVHAAGHCTFTPAEIAASIETVVSRLNTGSWDPTTPDAMNALGRALDPDTPSRFFNYVQVKYNRPWFPTPSEYIGRGARP